MASYLSEPDITKLNDKELLESLARSDIVESGKAILVQEMTRRNLVELKKSIDNFNINSERSSKKIVILTWVLVVETAVLAIPILLDIFGRR